MGPVLDIASKFARWAGRRCWLILRTVVPQGVAFVLVLLGVLARTVESSRDQLALSRSVVSTTLAAQHVRCVPAITKLAKVDPVGSLEPSCTRPH